MRNLIQAIRPEYLVTTEGTLPHGMLYSSMFWSGLFNMRVSALESKCVREIMNPRPPVVGCDANLMQVAQLLCEENRRRVAVEHEGRIVGVVREQELFHEISRLIFKSRLAGCPKTAICFVTAENPDPHRSQYASGLAFLCSSHLTTFEQPGNL
jgi:CBS domain.